MKPKREEGRLRDPFQLVLPQAGYLAQKELLFYFRRGKTMVTPSLHIGLVTVVYEGLAK